MLSPGPELVQQGHSLQLVPGAADELAEFSCHVLVLQELPRRKEICLWIVVCCTLILAACIAVPDAQAFQRCRHFRSPDARRSPSLADSPDPLSSAGVRLRLSLHTASDDGLAQSVPVLRCHSVGGSAFRAGASSSPGAQSTAAVIIISLLQLEQTQLVLFGFSYVLALEDVQGSQGGRGEPASGAVEGQAVEEGERGEDGDDGLVDGGDAHRSAMSTGYRCMCWREEESFVAPSCRHSREEVGHVLAEEDVVVVVTPTPGI